MIEKSDAEVLAEAGDYLESNGWWRGALLGPNGRQACGLGAVVFSQGWVDRAHGNDFSTAHNPHRVQVERVLCKVLKAAGVKVAGPNTSYFTMWNDDKIMGAGSKQVVLDAFRKAEKIERTGFDPDEGITL